MKNNPAFVLDSYAVLAHYQNEPGGPRVKAVLSRAEKGVADVYLKAHHPISYADAFALALAQEKQAALLTGDPEFRKVESLATIEWLPQA